MLIPGLVSVTFRDRSPKEILNEMHSARLDAIEWGGDVHVPAGKPGLAREVQGMTQEKGIWIAADGSYFRLGQQMDLEPWLETAAALGAPTMRIWAGSHGSRQVAPDERPAMIAELRALCERAAQYHLTISLEYHEATLTDDPVSTQRLLAEVGHAGLRSYWQIPKRACTTAELQDEFRAVRPWLSHVHIFNRDPNSGGWTTLHDATRLWTTLLAELSGDAGSHAVMIEFVREGSIAAFREDSAALRAIIASVQQS
jgi:sugar phosphate isomerase/epimerase